VIGRPVTSVLWQCTGKPEAGEEPQVAESGDPGDLVPRSVSTAKLLTRQIGAQGSAR